MSMTWHDITQRVTAAGVQAETPLRIMDMVIAWDEASLSVEGADGTCDLDITGRRRHWPARLIGHEKDEEPCHD